LVLDSFALTGRVAFVTGAGSGIGQRLAAALAEAGADVACFDRNHAAACRTAAEIKAIGRHAAVFSGDVTDAGTVSEAVTRAVDALGPISVGCNCAGIAGATAAEEMEPADFRRVVDVNLTGVFLSCQAEARVMLAYGGGSIINVASMSGTIVNRGLLQAHYNSSKAAVIHLSKSLAMEWARSGIRVNALSPGYTLTPMNRRPEVADRLLAYAEYTPLHRIAEVDDMAGPAVFLASDAARFCTGLDLIVDGGYVCW
jgi:NAD(P)-dependent dehydrogenase (short-subunit alcohol dehydrogenase family)